MAVLISGATGNFGDATTWKTASAVSQAYVNSEAATITVSTTVADSNAFTPAATPIDAIGIKISSISGLAGTISVSLRNSTTPGTRDFTVTINASDLQPNARGWVFFKNGSSVTPNGTDLYIVRVVRSVTTGTFTLFASTATNANMCRAVRMTTTGTPAAGDTLLIAGEFTGAGTSNTLTVTYNMQNTIPNSASFASASSQSVIMANLASQNTGSSNFWIGGWVKLTDKAATYTLLSKYNTTGNQVAFQLYYDSAADRFKFLVSPDGTSGSAVSVTASSFGSPTAATWYRIDAWYDGSFLKIAVNNGTVDSNAYASGTFASNAALVLGATAQSTTFLNGQLTVWGFWKKAPSGSDLTSLYNSGRGKLYKNLTTSDLTSIYSFWDLQESGSRYDSLGVNNQTSGTNPSQNTNVGITTAPISYGTISGVLEGISVNDKGILQLDSTDDTFYLKMKGVFTINAGGMVMFDQASGTTGSITGATNTGLTGRVTHTTNATPIVCTSVAHGLSTGNIIEMYGNYGNTAANGVFKVTVIDANNFSLDSTTGNGDNPYLDIPTGLWICPVAITSTAHGLNTDDIVSITGVVGNTAANGYFRIIKYDANTFLLPGIAGNYSYTSGGTWVKRSSIKATTHLIVEFDCSTNVDSGIEVWSDGVFGCFGYPRTGKTTIKQSTVIGSDTNSIGCLVNTSGTSVTWKEGAKFVNDGTWNSQTFNINGTDFTISSVSSTTSLTLDSSAGTITGGTGIYKGVGASKVVNVEDTTAWLPDDQLVLASSSRRYQDIEAVTINCVNSSTQITSKTAANTGYHSGLNDANGDVRAEVINTTRNIRIRGISTSLQGYVAQKGSKGRICCNYTELYQLGSASTDKRGISTFTGASVEGFNLWNCSIWAWTVSSSVGIFAQNSSGICCPIIDGCSLWISSTSSGTNNYVNSNTSGSYKFINNVSISQLANGQINLVDVGGIVSNNICSGGASGGNGIIFSVFGSNSQVMGVVQNNTVHGGSNNGISINFYGMLGVVDGSKIWRTLQSSGNTGGLFLASAVASKLYITNSTLFGNPGNIYAPGCVGVIFKNLTVNGGANLVSSNAFAVTNFSDIIFVDSSFDETTVSSTATLQYQNSSGPSSTKLKIIFVNCGMPSTYFNTTIGNYVVQDISQDSYVVSLNHNRVNTDHRAWIYPFTSNTVFTLLQTDTSIYKAASPSIRITPKTASLKARTNAFQVPVASGQTITPSIWVRKSAVGDGAAYNGNQPRLLLVYEPHIGVTRDYILATASASTGTWEQLSGTSITFTDSGVAKVVVDCDGTTGWINIDDFSCANAQSTRGFDYWALDLFGPAVVEYPTTAGASGGFIIGG